MDHARNAKRELVLAVDSPSGNYWCSVCDELAHRRGESIDHRMAHFYHHVYNPECILSVADRKGYWGLTPYGALEILQGDRPDYKARWCESIECLMKYKGLDLMQGRPWAKKPILYYLRQGTKTNSNETLFQIVSTFLSIPGVNISELILAVTHQYDEFVLSFFNKYYRRFSGFTTPSFSKRIFAIKSRVHETDGSFIIPILKTTNREQMIDILGTDWPTRVGQYLTPLVTDQLLSSELDLQDQHLVWEMREQILVNLKPTNVVRFRYLSEKYTGIKSIIPDSVLIACARCNDHASITTCLQISSNSELSSYAFLSKKWNPVVEYFVDEELRKDSLLSFERKLQKDLHSEFLNYVLATKQLSDSTLVDWFETTSSDIVKSEVIAKIADEELIFGLLSSRNGVQFEKTIIENLSDSYIVKFIRRDSRTELVSYAVSCLSGLYALVESEINYLVPDLIGAVLSITRSNMELERLYLSTNTISLNLSELVVVKSAILSRFPDVTNPTEALYRAVSGDIGKFDQIFDILAIAKIGAWENSWKTKRKT